MIDQFKNFANISPKWLSLWPLIPDPLSSHEALTAGTGHASGHQWLRGQLLAVFDGTRELEATGFFKQAQSIWQEHGSFWGCSNGRDFRQFLDQTTAFMQVIREADMGRQLQLQAVHLAIGADGTCYVMAGWTRFLAAICLDLEEIAVKVDERHPQWHALRSQICDYERQNRGVYAPLLHPDLFTISSWYSHDRFDMIWKHMDPKTQTVLDMGSHWGYMSARLSLKGKNVTAVEGEDGTFQVLEKLRRAGQFKYQAVHADIFDYMSNRPRFDAILALNLFHHFLMEEKVFQQFINLLNQIQANEMFFMAHHPSEPIMEGAYANMEPQAFAETILAHSVFNEFVEIGQENRRIMYKFQT